MWFSLYDLCWLPPVPYFVVELFFVFSTELLFLFWGIHRGAVELSVLLGCGEASLGVRCLSINQPVTLYHNPKERAALTELCPGCLHLGGIKTDN